jgi:hypothetical protein
VVSAKCYSEKKMLFIGWGRGTGDEFAEPRERWPEKVWKPLVRTVEKCIELSQAIQPSGGISFNIYCIQHIVHLSWVQTFRETNYLFGWKLHKYN